MSTATPPAQKAEVPLPQVELIETDGEPLESDWHRAAINLLIESIRCHLWGRTDFYVGGNMFIYFNVAQARNRDYRGPDFFFVRGVPLEPQRPYWAVWDEGGRYPNVIIELLSPSTARADRTTKKDLYQDVFRTRDYFCYDPDAKGLEGWTLDGGLYVPLTPNEHGRLWCKELGLWLGAWDGEYLGIRATWLRWFTPAGEVVPIFADVSERRAEAEKQRAEAEKQRADALEAEVARLKAQLAAQQGPQTP